MVRGWRGICPLVALVLVATACGGTRDSGPGHLETSSAPAPLASAATTPSRPEIVVLGDSLTAGLGLQADQAYPAILQQRVDAGGFGYQVVNAGVSGDTSAGGLQRLDWALSGDVRVLIVALGGNDGLRGLSTEGMQQNLAQIIERAEARHVKVILAGMEAPPNYGRAYTVAFHQVFPALAARYHVPFVPFLLEHVAGIDTLNQHDGIHPTAEGAQIVATNIWTVLKPELGNLAAANGGVRPVAPLRGSPTS